MIKNTKDNIYLTYIGIIFMFITLGICGINIQSYKLHNLNEEYDKMMNIVNSYNNNLTYDVCKALSVAPFLVNGCILCLANNITACDNTFITCPTNYKVGEYKCYQQTINSKLHLTCDKTKGLLFASGKYTEYNRLVSLENYHTFRLAIAQLLLVLSCVGIVYVISKIYT